MLAKPITRLLLNACRRCGGTLIGKLTVEGYYFRCLQCGKHVGLISGSFPTPGAFSRPSSREGSPFPGSSSPGTAAGARAPFINRVLMVGLSLFMRS